VSVTLELSPELHARLARAAQARGLSLEAYMRIVIERAGVADPNSEAELTEFRAVLDSLAEASETLPILSSEQFRRECIYQDHE